MFRPSRNFKVPQVYGGQWKNHQTFQKWDPISKRLVQVSCCPAPPIIPPEVCTAPSSVTLSISGSDLIITFPSGVLMTSYDGWLVNVTDGVDVGLLIADAAVGGTYTSPGTASTLTAGKQYNIRLDCTGTGDPACNFTVYSNTITAPTPNFQFIRVSGSGDPGSGNFSISIVSLPNVLLNISVTDKNSQDATSWLSTGVASSTTIKVQKDLSNYVLLTRNSNTDNTTYWQFDCNISSSVGIVNNGDTVTITYS
jgi:hypothetical protein